jgi:cob(I)alamin adenosyltransferase
VSIATRTGDDGTTGLLHGQRVPKNHPQIEALGAFDELNVEIGGARLASKDAGVLRVLLGVQSSLIAVMGEIACAEEDAEGHAHSKFARLTDDELSQLDELVRELEKEGLKMDGWASPGANPAALAFDRARVAARRAERRLAALPCAVRQPRPLLLKWTNRLSDALWLLARRAESRPQA